MPSALTLAISRRASISIWYAAAAIWRRAGVAAGDAPTLEANRRSIWACRSVACEAREERMEEPAEAAAGGGERTGAVCDTGCGAISGAADGRAAAARWSKRELSIRRAAALPRGLTGFPPYPKVFSLPVYTKETRRTINSASSQIHLATCTLQCGVAPAAPTHIFSEGK